MQIPRINIIGSGKLGRTLIRLFADHQLVEIGDVFNRSPVHSLAAIEFCGSGRLCESIDNMNAADIWLIATPDDAIAEIAEALIETFSKTPLSWTDTVVFHASGLHSSTLLEALKNKGAAIASAHPVHSFANPEQSIISYRGTTCTIEGDPKATEQLSYLFAEIGSTVIPIQASGKALYHAATVLGSNYLAVLKQAALDMLEQAGITAPDAKQILQPLMAQSLQNLQNLGPVEALTGPIARGDIQTLTAHLDAITDQDSQHLSLYKELGKVALQLARQQAHLDDARLAAMARLFSTTP